MCRHTKTGLSFIVCISNSQLPAVPVAGEQVEDPTVQCRAEAEADSSELGSTEVDSALNTGLHTGLLHTGLGVGLHRVGWDTAKAGWEDTHQDLYRSERFFFFFSVAKHSDFQPCICSSNLLLAIGMHLYTRQSCKLHGNVGDTTLQSGFYLEFWAWGESVNGGIDPSLLPTSAFGLLLATHITGFRSIQTH